MNKTKIQLLFGTSNIIHSDVWRVQSLQKQSTLPNINCTNNAGKTNKRKHIVVSLLIAVATILIVGCPEPTKDKGSSPPSISPLLASLVKAVDMPEKTKGEKEKKQQEIQNILKKIKGKDPAYKHNPKDKDELATFIKAEIWAQGKDGNQDWKADLNNIDTSLVKDMSYLFSNNKDKGYKLDKWMGAIPVWNVPKGRRSYILTRKNIVDRIKKTQANKDTKKKQVDLKTLLLFIDKPKPTSKDELVMFIKAEIWAQGKDGNQDWKANLNNIDTSLVKDMSYLFSNTNLEGTKPYGLHGYSGLPPMWALKKPDANADNMYKGSQALPPTWYITKKIETELKNEDGSAKQNAIKSFFANITNNHPSYKHKPTSKDELVLYIKAEIWSQGKDGNQDWDADLNNIDTSLIKDMSYLFSDDKNGYELEKYEGNISKWNVRSVTTMRFMFSDASAFNQDIGGWDVRRVKDMSSMFQRAEEFNQDISKWDVRRVTNMSSMFQQAEEFNQDISKWDVRRVTNMRSMFNFASAFNQDIGDWDVRSVKDMGSMFQDARAFDQNIGKWDVRRVTNMDSMFENAVSFNQDIGDWDVRSVKYMSSMFQSAIAFNQDIRGWDVSNVKDMYAMFQSAIAFNQDIGGWDVSSVTTMDFMFFGASAFNQNLNNWDRHLKKADGNYRKISVDNMFTSSQRANNPPSWLAKIPQ